MDKFKDVREYVGKKFETASQQEDEISKNSLNHPELIYRLNEADMPRTSQVLDSGMI